MKPIFVPIFLAVFISCGGQKKPSADVGRKIVGDTVPKFSYDSTQDLLYNIDQGYKYEFTEDGETFRLVNSDGYNNFGDSMNMYYLVIEKLVDGKWVYNTKIEESNRGVAFDDINKDGYPDVTTDHKLYNNVVIYVPPRKSFDTVYISMDFDPIQLDSVNKVFYSFDYASGRPVEEYCSTLFRFKDYKLVNYYTLVYHQIPSAEKITSVDLYKYVKNNPKGQLVKRYKYSDEFKEDIDHPLPFWKNHYKQLLKDY